MRIVIFTDTYPPFINGVSTSTYNLVQVLRQNGHTVLPVVPRTTDGKTTISNDLIELSGIVVKNIYGYRITNIYNSKVFKFIKNFKPDIIHIQTDFSVGQFGYIVARKLSYAAVVYTYHTQYEDYTYYITKGMADRLLKRFTRAYTKISSKMVTEYITPSVKTMEYMRNVAGIDTYVNVVPTGIDFSLFENSKIDQEEVEQFKKEHKITAETKVFLILGRIAGEKSMDVSIRGYHRFRQEFPNIPCKLFVVGDGPQRSELQNLVYELKEENTVEFLGPQPADKVSFFYHLADIYTSASLTETQGLTFMESMASGTIVLARFDTQLSETIVDGETGFFFHDLESFAKKAKYILDLKEEEKAAIVENAYKIVDVYSIDKFYNNILRVYNRAIRKKW